MSGYDEQHAPQQRLRVLELALDNARAVKRLIARRPNYGDLHNQIARASISVVSNIAEGDGQRGDATSR